MGSSSEKDNRLPPTYEVDVVLPTSTPVVGCELVPDAKLKSSGPTADRLPEHYFTFSWYWDKIACSVHQSELATVQCMSCAALSLPLRWSYHCSTKCFLDAWPKHVASHNEAAQTASEANAGNQHTTKKHESCGSWPVFGDESKVCSSKNYRPSMDDLGFCLRLESAALDSSTGTKLCPINIIVTDPVIGFPPRSPRCMIQVGGSLESWKVNSEVQSSDDVTFSVLSYNILANQYLLMKPDAYSSCPNWALLWYYRGQNLLKEIMEYDADIICLQEVDNDLFDSFFKPELTKRGYSVLYKKKSGEGVYTGSRHINDGCATFYRRDLFKEIEKYEVEFSKTAESVVEALEPGLKNKGYRLKKENVALVVVLEALKRGATQKDHQSRICVANTHIFANIKYPDVKLYQVVNLIQGLQKIAESKVPMLICADLNSVPGSDPHRFLLRGKIESTYEKKETDPLGIYRILRLHHSLPLKSAYSSLCESKGIEEKQLEKMNPNNREPQFTNFTSKFSGTLDYILYTADSLIVQSLLELLDKESIRASWEDSRRQDSSQQDSSQQDSKFGLPTPVWSSDHIALMARFRLKPSTTSKSSPPPLPRDPWKQAADSQ